MVAPTILPGQLRLILAIATVYIIAWYAYLGHVPLGLYPAPAEQAVLDSAFELSKGRSIEGISVTAYELALSIGARFVSDEKGLVFLARFINALALILTTAACAHAAGIYWKKNRPVWIAGLLTGLNPVLVFWSAEVSPALLAVLFSCLSFTLLLRWLRQPSPQRSLVIGLMLSIGTVFETSLLFFALIWPAVAWLYPNRRRTLHLVAGLAFPALTFLIISASSIQLQSTPSIDVSNLGRGIYETFNSHEVYDGKSYGLHNKLNVFLFVNPLHWGLIFILALSGVFIRLKNGHKGNSIVALLLCLVIFSISYALNDGGSKSRALLYPILAIYAGGISMMLQVWNHASKPTKRKIIAGVLLVAGLCYSDFYGARSHTNWEADYSFLAEANLALERSKSAAEWAEKAIELNPDRDDMRSIILQATFNGWALSPSPSTISSETAKIHLEAAQMANADDPNTRAIEALYLFKLKESDQAFNIWKQVRDQSALALICLYWTGQAEKTNSRELQTYEDDLYYKLLVKAANINRDALAYSEGEETLDNMLAVAR